MVGVREFLTHVPEREKGGQTALDRFDYQTAWGVSRLLDLHEKGSNYALAFEFHDDIVALDDADAPTSAIFYQVKTKASGNWSFAQITQRKSSKGVKKSSFAGKMFDNFVRSVPRSSDWLSLVINRCLTLSSLMGKRSSRPQRGRSSRSLLRRSLQKSTATTMMSTPRSSSSCSLNST